MARFYPTGGTGGANVSVVTALAEDVAKGKVIVGPDGKPITGTLELTGTAADSQVLAGQTYYNTDLKTKRTGAMTNRGAWNSSGLAAGAAVTIPAGYHNGGGRVTAKDLASQTSGDATAAQIWTGKKAWVNGKQITGTLATQGGSTTTPGTAAKTIVTPNKIVTGSIIVAGDANLVPGNIKKGVTIFGVQGTHSGYVPSATDLYLRGNNPAGFAVSGTQSRNPYTFQSGAIYVAGSYGYAIKYLLSASSYNLSSYTYVNFEFNNIAGDSTRFRVLDTEENILASAETTGTGSKTLSLDISSVNKTMRVGVYVHSDEMTSNTNAVQVYRIWLS